MRTLKIAFCVMAFFSAEVQSAEFSIKGLSLDTQYEVASSGRSCNEYVGYKICSMDMPGGTVGGKDISAVAIKYDTEDYRATYLHFSFKSDDFEDIRDAVKEKYKSLKCIKSIVHNAMGAAFENQVCSIDGKTETLRLERLSSSISKGSLMIASHKALRLEMEKKARSTKDI